MKNVNNTIVSLIIANYNGYIYLKQCLDSINELDFENKEIIFVDNNSNDNSIKFVKENYPNVKIIENDKNYYFTGANNIGARKSKGKYIVLLNNDTIVDKNWLNELVKVAESSDKIGIVASKIYYYDRKNIINFAGGICNKYGKASHLGKLKEDKEFRNPKKYTFYACGAALLIKREVYEKICLFDFPYHLYYEDIDLCWRTWICGYNIAYAPKAFIYHKVGGTSRNRSRQLSWIERNRLRTFLKNYTIKSLFNILPIYFYQKISIIRFTLYKNFYKAIELLKILIKSLLWNTININSLIKQRKNIKNLRKRSDQLLFSLMKYLEKLNKTY